MSAATPWETDTADAVASAPVRQLVVFRTFSFAGPCGGGPGTATVEFNDKFHVTAFDDGDAVVSANQAGTFEFDPDDPAAPSSSGRYRNGFSDTFTQNATTNTSVFSVVGRDEDGAQVRFQVRTHFTFANGELRVDNFTVSCPSAREREV